MAPKIYPLDGVMVLRFYCAHTKLPQIMFMHTFLSVVTLEPSQLNIIVCP